MESHEPQSPEDRKVALLGFADTWKQAPFDDTRVEIWGLNELWKYLPRWSRWFELHDSETLGVTKRDLSEGEAKRHLEWLSRDHGPDRPIYMQPQFCGATFPNATPYPLARMIDLFGRYFTSSIGYMLALAIAEGYTWIGLYGIDLASDVEYKYQRANAEYFCGIARGMGRTIVTAEGSAILKAGHLYGFEKALEEAGGIKQAVTNHLAALKKRHDEGIQTLNTLDGAIAECENTLKLLDFKERGCAIQTY